MDEQAIVITGGHGFVGSHLTREARRRWRGRKIIVWDKEASRSGKLLARQVDLTDREQVRSALAADQPKWLIHLAAIAAVPVALKNPQLVERINTEATEQMLAAARQVSPATKFLVASTADIYGQGTNKPLAEQSLDWAKPNNPYALSKWRMEKIIEERFKDRVIRARPFPHIGPGQGLGFVTADFAAQIVALEATGRAGKVRVGNLKAKRDFTDVRDVVKAYCLLIEKGRLGEVYHVASGQAIGIEEMLNMLIALAKVEVKIVKDQNRMRPNDIRMLIGDASKLREETGWVPAIKIEQSLADVLEWWRKKINNKK